MDAMIQSVNTIERLTILKDMLKDFDKHFKHRFDMEAWYCGTAACALGSAAVYPPFIELGLSLKGTTLPDYYAPYFNGSRDYWAGVRFFGITFYEALYLFNPEAYSRTQVKPYDVAERVAELISKYKEKENDELHQ